MSRVFFSIQKKAVSDPDISAENNNSIIINAKYKTKYKVFSKKIFVEDSFSNRLNFDNNF
ncbi:hypothetical protein BPAA_093 [Blattabacterium cuenoti BPAA]|uniref:Uncharacterized protein n=1 Tax=Blattabacterium cuenoti BPAA TaxID=1229512 RepID=M4ZSA4_9FLAO|nr:hypothetical protein BPAA_093 [Blattabacterium cuenoti BPAA]